MWITVGLVHNVQRGGTPEKNSSVVKSLGINWSPVNYRRWLKRVEAEIPDQTYGSQMLLENVSFQIKK